MIMPYVSMENVDEEWKEIWKPEYLKTISAFYNTEGGRFIIGRRDDGSFVGVCDAKKTLKSVSDSIQNTLGIAVNVHAQILDDQLCVIIDIPKGKKLIDYDGRFYKRVGNTTQMIRREELKDIIADERGTFWMDESSGKFPEYLSADAIKRFVEMGKAVYRIPESVDSSDISGVLHRYGLLCDDGTVTVAGVLLFSEHPRRFRHGAFLKIGEFDDKGILRREDIVDAPIILVPDMAVGILLDRYVPPIFTYENTRRELSYPYPRDAVRELIVNAVVHMNYLLQEPVTVAVHPDKIEIFDSGDLPNDWTVETLLGKHNSIPRNRTLANVFHDAGYVENWAQGIRKVIESCEANDNSRPKFVQELGGLSVTILSSNSKEEHRQETIVPSDSFVPTDNQMLILDCIASNPYCTYREISETTGLSERAVAYNLSKMVKSGIVSREGNTRSGMWVVTLD